MLGNLMTCGKVFDQVKFDYTERYWEYWEYYDHLSNGNILRKMRKRFMPWFKKKQLSSFSGHTMRKQGMENLTITGDIEDKSTEENIKIV